jgi:pyridoxine kinase
MPETLVAAMRDRLLPLADIVTPNRFELEVLTGRKSTDNAGLIASARTLGASEVVVTSAFAEPGKIANLFVAEDNAELVTHRVYAEAPHGVGDLLAALYLARRLTGKSPTDALVAASASTAALIERAASDSADELPLAAGQDLLLAPRFDVDVTRLVAEGVAR